MLGMKKLMLLLIVALSVVSCKKDEVNTKLYISGKIENLGNDTIYAYGMGVGYDRMDTIITIDGQFKIDFVTDTTCICLLNIGDSIQVPLFIEKDIPVFVSGDVKKSGKIRAVGGQYNEQYSLFADSISVNDSISEAVVREKAEDFITKNPQSVVNIYFLHRYFVSKGMPDVYKVKLLIDGMAGNMRDWDYVGNLRKKISRMEYAEIERTIPYFSFEDEQGKNYSRYTNELSGKALVLSFWSSWSDSLVNIQNNKAIRELYGKYKNSKYLSFMSVSMDFDKEDWKKFVKKHNMNWKQVFNNEGYESEIVKSLGISNLPCNIFIDSNGTIIERDISADKMKKLCDEHVKEQKSREKKKYNF